MAHRPISRKTQVRLREEVLRIVKEAGEIGSRKLIERLKALPEFYRLKSLNQARLGKFVPRNLIPREMREGEYRYVWRGGAKK